MDVLTNLTVVIILQHMCISNHYIVHLKRTQYYMSIISQESWKGKRTHGSMASAAVLHLVTVRIVCALLGV